MEKEYNLVNQSKRSNQSIILSYHMHAYKLDEH